MKKKLFCTIISMLILQVAVLAETNWTTSSNVLKVNTIGKALLSKNDLPTQVQFEVIETDEINAFANGENQICVYTGLLNFVDNDAELAGVIGHEIGHIVNNHVAKQSVISVLTSSLIASANISSKLKTGANAANSLTMLKMSRSEEYEADITGADLLANAGYNPLAMVSVLYKIGGNYVDVISTHPSADKRTMYVYDYIAYNYPDAIKAGYNTDSFKQFMKYATVVVENRNASSFKTAVYNKKQEKLQKKRKQKLQQYKNSDTSNFWTQSYNTIKSVAQ